MGFTGIGKGPNGVSPGFNGAMWPGLSTTQCRPNSSIQVVPTGVLGSTIELFGRFGLDRFACIHRYVVTGLEMFFAVIEVPMIPPSLAGLDLFPQGCKRES